MTAREITPLPDLPADLPGLVRIETSDRQATTPIIMDMLKIGRASCRERV